MNEELRHDFNLHLNHMNSWRGIEDGFALHVAKKQ
jgi:hypothetical protein